MTPRPFPAAAAIAALFVVGGACAGEPAFVATAPDVPEATVDPGVVSTPVPTTSQPADVAPGPVASGAFEPAVRGTRVAVPLAGTTVAQPVDGDCGSWRPLLERYGIPYDEALPIMQRESDCSNVVNWNANTRDASFGPFQANRWGSLAAWWDEGGYTEAVMSTPEGAVAAAAVLYHSCGWSPWRKPYGCDGTYLRTPEPKWGEW